MVDWLDYKDYTEVEVPTADNRVADKHSDTEAAVDSKKRGFEVVVDRSGDIVVDNRDEDLAHIEPVLVELERIQILDDFHGNYLN